MLIQHDVIETARSFAICLVNISYGSNSPISARRLIEAGARCFEIHITPAFQVSVKSFQQPGQSVVCCRKLLPSV